MGLASHPFRESGFDVTAISRHRARRSTGSQREGDAWRQNLHFIGSSFLPMSDGA
jgi:hypothetical protein